MIDNNIYGYTLKEMINFSKKGTCDSITKKNPHNFNSSFENIWSFAFILNIYNFYFKLIENYKDVQNYSLKENFNKYNIIRINTVNYLYDKLQNIINIIINNIKSFIELCVCVGFITGISIIGGFAILYFGGGGIWLIFNLSTSSFEIMLKIGLIIAFCIIGLLVIGIIIVPLILIIGICIILLLIPIVYVGGLFVIIFYIALLYLDTSCVCFKTIVYGLKIFFTTIVYFIVISLCFICLVIWKIIISIVWFIYCTLIYIFAYDVDIEQNIV